MTHDDDFKRGQFPQFHSLEKLNWETVTRIRNRVRGIYSGFPRQLPSSLLHKFSLLTQAFKKIVRLKAIMDL